MRRGRSAVGEAEKGRRGGRGAQGWQRARAAGGVMRAGPCDTIQPVPMTASGSHRRGHCLPTLAALSRPPPGDPAQRQRRAPQRHAAEQGGQPAAGHAGEPGAERRLRRGGGRACNRRRHAGIDAVGRRGPLPSLTPCLPPCPFLPDCPLPLNPSLLCRPSRPALDPPQLNNVLAREANGLALAPDRMSPGERALVGAVLGAPVTQVGWGVGEEGE